LEAADGGDAADGFGEVHVVMQFDELEDIAAHVTGTAEPELFLGVHLQARMMIIMERTETRGAAAADLQGGSAGLDDAEDVGAGADVVYDGLRNAHESKG